jgi:ubiquinol-cytochrome c reductase cytochrome b subunit
MAKRVWAWFADRWPFVAVWKAVTVEDVPGGPSIFYSLGSAVLFVFIIQAVTGVIQLFYYVPTVDHAYDSINYLRIQIPLGWLIHGLHYWGAQAMVVLAAIHLSQVFIWGAHMRPREFTWLVGVVNLLLVLTMSFTGAALPWDVKGYWATEVGTSIAGTVPLIGNFLKRLVRGTMGMGQLALDRMFTVHVLIVPALLAVSVLVHLVAFRRKHSAGPWSEKRRRLRTGPFWPDQMIKDTALASLVLVVLLVLCVWTPAPTTGPADATDQSVQPKPEWDFLFLYQFLKAFKGPWEPVGTVVFPVLAVLFLFIVPFLSRKGERAPLRRPVGMGLFVAAWAAIIALTISGALSHPGLMKSAKPAAAAAAGPAAKTAAQAGAKAGASLFQSEGCIACHTINGRGGSVGPDLSAEGGKRSAEWLAQQVRDPGSHFPHSIMPAFGSRLTSSQVQDLVDYLSSLKGSPSGGGANKRPASGEPSPAAEAETAPTAPARKAPPAAPSGAKESARVLSRGEELFHSEGCVACHTINGQGGSVGPDLSAEGGKRKADWLAQQIRDSRSHFPHSIMPAFGSRLTSSQVQDLVDYLLSLKGAPSGGGAEGVPAAEAGSASRAESPAKASAQVSSRGEKIFRSAGCVACHTIHGSGGSVGPDLSDEGRKRSAGWIVKQIEDPKAHDPQTVMPSFASQLDSSEIEALAGYLSGLGGGPPGGPAGNASPGGKPPSPPIPRSEPTPGAPRPSETGPAAMIIGDAKHGAILFSQTCAQCHGPEGTDKVPNPGSDDGTVPPLNPIDPAFKSADPAVFAANIDRFIQHGSVPAGPHPEFKMPDFGDSNSLTQQAIAQIEAYVLSLNGVDRARIMHPGIPPKIFILVTIFCFAVAGWILWLLVPTRRKPH